MKSEHVTELLHDYLDGSLPPSSAAAISRHLDSCPSCQETQNQLRTVQRSLSVWPAPSPRQGVFERMLKVAVLTQAAPAPWWRGPMWSRAGLSGAAVLTLMLGFWLGVRSGHRDLPGPQIMLAAAPIELGPERQSVTLMFRASDTLHSASISVWLPDDVQIAGRPNVTHLSWTTDLKRGPNLLELPLLATGPRGGTLLVHLAQGTLVRTLEVPITIRLPKSPAAAVESQRAPPALS